ncbi:elongation factor G [Cognatishimia sp. SS12]|uniref:elongation factor G n=1 Tax=Cognatishimia sp. SS12 TaxID=2979465 RepID=UPI00232D83B9|nr:elongation factor G [Cognatishimia sp. SS12]MDC0739429.1 elongation factor G [Cognatishimia sp. SS12]
MRVFTIIGPSQTGKSTLAAALAGLEGTQSKKFSVEGVGTITPFTYMNDEWAVIDMDGGIENLSHAGPTVACSDAAVLCVSADADAADLAAPYMRLLEESDVPSILFVNRVDTATSRISEIAAALQTYCNHHILLRQVPLRSGDAITGTVDLVSERAWKFRDGHRSALVEIPAEMQARENEARTEMLETLADFDDALLEQLIEDKQPLPEEIYDVAKQTLQHHDLVPTLIGSATHGNGIQRLMKSLRHEAPDVGRAWARLSTKGQAVAVPIMADQVKHLGKTVMLRVLQGQLAASDQLGGSALGGLTHIGAQSQADTQGCLKLAVKSDHLNLGQVYDQDGKAPLPGWARPHVANYRRVITPDHEKDDARLSGALERLREIDPALRIDVDLGTGHAVLATQGPQHMRRSLALLEDRFGIKVSTRKVPPDLRETVLRPVRQSYRHRKQSGGAGQFADVQVELRPQDRGSGFFFSDLVKGGAVPKNYIPAVEAGAIEALDEGLHGYPVVDVAVTLLDGKHHAVDSSDYAFRQAGKNAVRAAIAKAGTVVLQPIMEVQIHVPSVFSGGLVPVISGLKGQVLGFEAHEYCAGWDVFRASLPMGSQDALAQALAAATRGTAWFESAFQHYTEVYEKDAIVA